MKTSGSYVKPLLGRLPGPQLACSPSSLGRVRGWWGVGELRQGRGARARGTKLLSSVPLQTSSPPLHPPHSPSWALLPILGPSHLQVEYHANVLPLEYGHQVVLLYVRLPGSRHRQHALTHPVTVQPGKRIGRTLLGRVLAGAPLAACGVGSDGRRGGVKAGVKGGGLGCCCWVKGGGALGWDVEHVGRGGGCEGRGYVGISSEGLFG